MFTWVKGRLNWYGKAVPSLGFLPFARMQLQRHLKTNEKMRLTSKYLDHPVIVRPRASDFGVFLQIFIEREYRCFDDIENSAGLIIGSFGTGLLASRKLATSVTTRVATYAGTLPFPTSAQSAARGFAGRAWIICHSHFINQDEALVLARAAITSLADHRDADRTLAGLVWAHRSINCDAVGCCNDEPPRGAAVK